MAWRRTLVVLHRDIGFLSLGLTLVYGLSGLAVNHRHDWNYNQSSRQESVRVGLPAELLSSLPADRREAIARDLDSLTREEQDLLVRAVGAALGRTGAPKNAFWRGPERLSLFYAAGDADTVDYAPSTGIAEHTAVRDRPLLRDLNFLHLNEGRGAWTYVADTFALCLVFLGLSGALIVKGRNGLRGRGGLLFAAGLLLPLVAVLLQRYF